MWATSSLTTVLTPTAVALGNFDGIHQGHRQVIQPILDCPNVLQQKTIPTVVTFHPHPQEFFSGQSRCLLTPLDEKIAELERLGVKQLVLLPFNQALADLTPDQFVEEILVNTLQATRISVGLNFCFGRKRAGTTDDLCTIAARHGVEVAIAPLKRLNGGRISSSAIRQLLQDGDIQHANTLLGRSYALVGTVVSGQQMGRKLGFPTANLQLPPEKFLPRYGVYAVRVQVCDRPNPTPHTPHRSAERSRRSPAPHPPSLHTGVMNLGYRPTVDGTRLVAEVHLFDWSQDLYGQTLAVSLEHFLRPEQTFASLDALKAQIQADCDAARTLLAAEA